MRPYLNYSGTESLRPLRKTADCGSSGARVLEATRQILDFAPATRVLILSVHESEQVVREVLAAGAQGYLLKSDAGRELVAAVRALLENKPYFTSRVAQMVLQGFLSAPMPQSDGKEPSRLSPREREIVQLLAEGKTTKQVAAVLGISTKTAETHRANVMRRLDFRSVVELVRYAIRNGIIEP